MDIREESINITAIYKQLSKEIARRKEDNYSQSQKREPHTKENENLATDEKNLNGKKF